ncbi:10123_t:CDS:10 [Funneliformis geosporum]|uniref:10123_t:CDS:1 n=1 Tax=Funneliformis geosporum TaxID=1117311 RepID=A0A9W4SQQ7_9GLOM|nr:10123_t:CDS:10 [Funneliformis geosporum]
MNLTVEEQINDEVPNDSLTLGQLKKIVKQFPNKQKPKEIAFTYTDTDSISNEIDEFYSYVEISQCFENKKSFEEGFDESWTTCTISERRTYIEYLLETLELKDPEKRFCTAKKLLYIAQGTFGESTSPEHHLELIIENNKLLRKCGALLSYFQALNHPDFISDRQAYIDDTNIEIGFYLTLLYMLVEVHRGDESFGSELVELDPPMSVFLFEIIASLREKEKNAKGYPVKKDVVRLINGLPPINNKEFSTKATPIDYHTFQAEATQKYPTYIPPHSPVIPMPFIIANQYPNSNNNNDVFTQNSFSSINNNSSPKSRKQQFQTNQRQPFIFPFSKSTPTVPKSIQEAGDLYLKFMYTNLGILQFWKEKDEMKKQQFGYSINDVRLHNEKNRSNCGREISNGINDTEAQVTKRDREKLDRIELLYRSILPHMQYIVIVLLKLLLATVSPNSNNVKVNDNGDSITKENVTINNGLSPDSNIYSSSSNGNSVEEIDIMRHREITSKAVSAILLLMLKYLKLSHILKFEYVSQLLVESNCLLLILKMFGLQDVSLTIKSRNDVEDLNFFRYCKNINDKHGSGKTCDDNPEDERSKEQPQIEHVDELNLIDNNVDSDYCWRNFFSAINFLRILQKLTKKKTHRVVLLVQYKSSAILKRILKVSHPLLELYSLKVLKSQIPFIGRKWRQGNMKIITSIYLHCRPDLRDEWIASSDADAEIEDALPQEQSLRALIKFYNERNYMTHDHQNGLLYHNDNRNSPDIFPPHHTKSLNHVNSAYIADDIMLDESFLSNWEQWLQDEVYGFSVTKPHLNTIDEYYNDDGFLFTNGGDGSEWDTPILPLVDEQDPFTSVEWENIKSTDMLGPLAPNEVTIWQPTPYQSDAED